MEMCKEKMSGRQRETEIKHNQTQEGREGEVRREKQIGKTREN